MWLPCLYAERVLVQCGSLGHILLVPSPHTCWSWTLSRQELYGLQFMHCILRNAISGSCGAPCPITDTPSSRPPHLMAFNQISLKATGSK